MNSCRSCRQAPCICKTYSIGPVICTECREPYATGTHKEICSYYVVEGGEKK